MSVPVERIVDVFIDKTNVFRAPIFVKTFRNRRERVHLIAEFCHLIGRQYTWQIGVAIAVQSFGLLCKRIVGNKGKRIDHIRTPFYFL